MSLTLSQAKVLGALGAVPQTIAEIRTRARVPTTTARAAVRVLAYLGLARGDQWGWFVTGAGRRVMSQPAFREYRTQSSGVPDEG